MSICGFSDDGTREVRAPVTREVLSLKVRESDREDMTDATGTLQVYRDLQSDVLLVGRLCGAKRSGP